MHFTGSLGPLYRGTKHFIKCTTGALGDTKFVFSRFTDSVKITCAFRGLLLTKLWSGQSRLHGMVQETRN